MDIPVYYRSADPIQNLRLRIRLRQLTTTFKDNSQTNEETQEGKVHVDSDSDDDQQTASLLDKSANKKQPWSSTKKEWTDVFTWQDKKFGPREILMYRPGGVDGEEGNGDDILGKTAIEMEYREELRSRANLGNNLLKDTYPVCLFTYTDKDGFVPTPDMMKYTSSSKSYALNPVAKSIITLPQRGMQIDGNRYSQYGIGQRITRETPGKVFYIMAAVDVDPSSFQSRGVKIPEIYEVVLCRIKVLRDENMIEMTPGIPTKADTYDLPEDQKEIRHSFRTPNGSVYEYTITNEAESTDPDAERDIVAIENEQEKRALAEIRNRVSNQLVGCPTQPHQTRIHAFLEIVSAHNFDSLGGSLYVQYEVVLPPTEAWQWARSMSATKADNDSSIARYVAGIKSGAPDQSENDDDSSNPGFRTVKGVTQLSQWRTTKQQHEPGLLSGGSIAHFCFPIQLEALRLHDNFQGNDPVSHGTPQIFLHVKSRDSLGRHRTEGYGCVDLPREPGMYDLTVSTWKPKGTIRQQAEDFLIGGARQLDSSMHASIPQAHHGPFLNRYGFATEGSGSIRLRVNWIAQRFLDKRVVEKTLKANTNKKQNKEKAKRTIEEILSTLKLGGFSRRANKSGKGPDLIASVNRLRKEKERTTMHEEMNRQRQADESEREKRESRMAKLRALRKVRTSSVDGNGTSRNLPPPAESPASVLKPFPMSIREDRNRASSSSSSQEDRRSHQQETDIQEEEL